MSGQMRLLLDKSVVRRYFEGISALARDRSLTEEQRQAIILVHLTPKRGDELFIAQEAANLIRAHSHELAPGESLMLLRRVKVLYPGHYFKRWARRLHKRTFTREDAKVLALGAFGTDADGKILGVHIVVTLDQAMLRKWDRDVQPIAEHLHKMVVNLQEPFSLAKLPRVQLPEAVVGWTKRRLSRSCAEGLLTAGVARSLTMLKQRCTPSGKGAPVSGLWTIYAENWKHEKVGLIAATCLL